MTKAYINSLSAYAYGPGSDLNASFTVKSEGASISYDLTPEEADRIKNVLYQIVEERKERMVSTLTKMELTPLIGYDASKTIDLD